LFGHVYHLSFASLFLISPHTELKMLFGPGFFAGAIIGFKRVRCLVDIFKGLIPPVLFFAVFVPLMILPEGIYLIDGALRVFIITAIPYSFIGALFGWFLATSCGE